jgi:alpha-glucosidase
MVPHLDGRRVVETMREFTSHMSWTALTHSLNLVGSHDTTRARTLVAHDPRLSEVAAGLLLTMPSIPMITYGDEIGMEGAYGEDGRRPMPWDERRWDKTLFECYQSLIAARRESVALRRGGLRWVYAGDDVIVYLRESAQETALVHLARAAHDPVVLDARRLPGIADGHTAYGPSLEITRDSVSLAAPGPEVGVHVWTPARTRRGRRRDEDRAR